MGKFKGMRGFGGAMARAAKAVATGDTEAMMQATINWVKKGIIPDYVVRTEIINKLPKSIDDAAKKKGLIRSDLTVESVMEDLDKTPKVLELCELVGISRQMLENEVAGILGGNRG